MKYLQNNIEFNPNNLSIIISHDGNIYDDNSGADFTDEYKSYTEEQINNIKQEYRDYVFTEYIDEEEYCKQHGLDKFTDDEEEYAIDEFIKDYPISDNQEFVEKWNNVEDSIAEDIQKNKNNYLA